MNNIKLVANGLSFSAISMGQGPVVLFLHGFPDSNESFIPSMQRISQEGYTCIAPVLRGYEPATITHWSKLHVTDLMEDVISWMDFNKWDKIHFVGHDWGAIIAYSLGMYHPNRFYSLTAVSVPLLKHLPKGLLFTPQQYVHSWYVLFFQLPLVAELVLKANNFALIDFLWKEWAPSFRPPVEHLTHIKSQFEHPGVLASALSYYRNLMDIWTESGRETLVGLWDAKVLAPLQVVYGNEDGCIHSGLYDAMVKEEDYSANFRKVNLTGIGHFPHREDPERFSELCLQWFRKNL